MATGFIAILDKWPQIYAIDPKYIHGHFAQYKDFNLHVSKRMPTMRPWIPPPN